MQELLLMKEKVSLLERCPHFRGVLREGSSSTAADATCMYSVAMGYLQIQEAGQFYLLRITEPHHQHTVQVFYIIRHHGTGHTHIPHIPT